MKRLFILILFLIGMCLPAKAQTTWTSRDAAADNWWYSVTYGDGLFVAVAVDGTGNRVMTSPDGITWTGRDHEVDNSWRSVTYGDGLWRHALDSIDTLLVRQETAWAQRA